MASAKDDEQGRLEQPHALEARELEEVAIAHVAVGYSISSALLKIRRAYGPEGYELAAEALRTRLLRSAQRKDSRLRRA